MIEDVMAEAEALMHESAIVLHLAAMSPKDRERLIWELAGMDPEDERDRREFAARHRAMHRRRK